MNNLPSRSFATFSRKTIILSLILVSGIFNVAFGQIKAAKYEMSQYNYSKAIEILHQFIQNADPGTKSEATLLMADCYRLQNDMQDARSWYFKAIKLGNTDPLTNFYYAKALRACGDYEAAKKIFLRYDSLMPDDHRGRIYASFCDSAMAWDEKPFAFEVNNARHLNSSSADFGPVFYKDGIIFATERTMISGEAKESGLTGDGFLKLVFSKPRQKGDFYGDYSLPKLVPEFYTNGSNIGPATFSKDENEVFITRTFKSTLKSKDETEDGPSNQMKIFSAVKTGDSWSKMKPFFFNSNNYSVGYPALSPDGRFLYFVSDVEGGFGGTDIYVSTREGDNWSTPVNLGPVINSFGNETLPFISENGDLYFASDGHPGYGGLDIFVTRKVGNAWINPQNLGKPINSSYDDFALAMYKNDSVGLFSANRPGGRGEDDIYTFRVVGPLPALATQPVLSDIPNGIQKTGNKPPVSTNQNSAALVAVNVTPPASDLKPSQKEVQQEVKQTNQPEQKTETIPQKVVPPPGPATTQNSTAAKEKAAKEQKVTGERNFHVTSQETTYEAGKPVSVSAPAKVDAKSTAPDQKQKSQQNIPGNQQSATKPAEKAVSTPSPETAQSKTPSKEQNQKVTGERNFHVTSQETTYEAGKPVSVSAPATVDAKSQTPDQKQQAQQNVPGNQQAAQKPAEKAVPTPSPATAQSKTQPKDQNAKVTGERNFHVTSQETTYETGKPVSVSAPATVDAKTPGQETKQTQPVVQTEKTNPVDKLFADNQSGTNSGNSSAGQAKPQTAAGTQGSAAVSNGPEIMVSGCIKDEMTKEPVPAATLFFLDETRGIVFVHKANAGGCFRSRLTSGNNYQVKAMQTGYASACLQFNSAALGQQTETTLPNDFLLQRTGTFHSSLVDYIYYDYDRFFIRPDAEPTLNKIVKFLNENPVTVELGSHADCRGSQDYNMALTEKRAASAVHYLVQKGIKESRITSKWYGKSQLVNKCDCSQGIACTDAEHQLNRRTEFKIALTSVRVSELPINLDKFHEGDTIEAIYLPEDFFKNCNQHNLSGPLADLVDPDVFSSTAQNSGMKYTVQIGAFSYVTPNFNNVSDVMSCKGSDGILRCFVGKFSSLDEAIWFRDHLRSGEFKDAFVSVMDEKHNPSAKSQEILLSKR